MTPRSYWLSWAFFLLVGLALSYAVLVRPILRRLDALLAVLKP